LALRSAPPRCRYASYQAISRINARPTAGLAARAVSKWTTSRTSLVVLSLLLSAAGAFAQTRLQANVPFAFTVGKAHVPAGTGEVKKDFETFSVMIRNVRTGKAVLAMGTPQNLSGKTAKLVFRHVGDQYTLTQIWGAEGRMGMALAVRKPSHKLDSASAPATAGNTFEIALK
jgi:hypothetical protein